MFGYIRPQVGQMLVSENELYRSIYCGLCRAMGQHTGCASRLSLSYDFVFLAAFRAALLGIPFEIERHRCAVHPLIKRAMAKDSEVFAYTARAAAILNFAKLKDDIADESGRKRLRAKMLVPGARAVRRRAGGMGDLEGEITKSLTALSALENEGCASLDETAEKFGDVLGTVFAYGLTDTERRIAYEVGRAVGRFIYVTDAADDAADDAVSGQYNPILRLYAGDGDVSSLLAKRTAADRGGRTQTRTRLTTDIAESIYISALNDLSKLQNALELIDFTRCQPQTAGIVKNIAYLGMPEELRRVLALT